jgi:type III secretion protein U
MAEKTQKPTQRRLREARKKGEVARSRELTSLPGFVAAWVCLWLGAGYAWKHLTRIAEHAILAADPATDVAPDVAIERWVPQQIQGLAVEMAWLLLPLFGVSIACIVLIGGLQTRGMISWVPVTPKFERINPAQGLRKLVSSRNLFELGKMLLKTALLLGMLFYCVSASLDVLLHSVYTPAGDLLRVVATLAWRLMGWAALIYAVGAVLDYAHQRYEFMKQQKMSIEEVRRDRRETEGDPRIKARRRSIWRETAFSSPMSSLSAASVVVVNPTHVSVALYYARGETPLPRVIAKGLDAAALEIRTRAKRYGVPVLEDPPLARRLFREVELDHYINEDMIDGVAAVFRWAKVADQRPDSLRLALPEAESDTSHSVNQPSEVRHVDLAAQSGDMHVDHVVEGSGSADIFPNLMR